MGKVILFLLLMVISSLALQMLGIEGAYLAYKVLGSAIITGIFSWSK